jgi:hypothetical protein
VNYLRQRRRWRRGAIGKARGIRPAAPGESRHGYCYILTVNALVSSIACHFGSATRESHQNPESVALLEIVKPLSGLPGDIDNCLLGRREGHCVVENGTLCVFSAPESASKCVSVGMDDIYMDEVVDGVIVCDPVAVVASYQLDVAEDRESLQGVSIDILLADGVLVSGECVDPGDGIEDRR